MKKAVRKSTKEEAEQTFSLRAPGARSVRLAGDFTNWQQGAIPMKPASDGLWSVSIALPTGTYQYRFLVDGEWRDDPECRQRAPNPYGSQNMVRVVSPTPRKSARAAEVPAKGHQARPEWQPVCATPAETARPRISAL